MLISPGNPYYLSFSPSLTLGYVAAATPADWEIQIFDENVGQLDYSRVNTDLVGITAMTPQARRGYEIAGIFKKRGIPVVMGGVHISSCPEEALRYCDAVVVGEAELIWQKVLDDLSAGTMSGIYENREFIDLARLPELPRQLFKGFHPFNIIKTTRGCPFNCDFCCISAFHGARYRRRPIDDVIKEMKQIRNRYLFLADDNIIGSGNREDDERAKELLTAMIDAKVNKIWMSQACIHVARNPEMLLLLKKSGCRALLLGFESIEQEALKGRGKHQNLKAENTADYYQKVIDTLHKHGIAINGFFFNGPSDSRETIEGMSEFLAATDIDLITHTFLTPLPGTRLYKRYERQLCAKNYPEDWDKYDYSRMLIEPDKMSLKEYYQLRNEMVKKTHSFKRILKITIKGLIRSRSPLVGLFILVVNLIQKRSYRREFIRNCSEIKEQ